MEHKEEIQKTRLSGLGSSDAKMVASVGRAGQLNETARLRIAQMLGIVERKDFTTKSMSIGNEIESILFDIVKSKAENAVSNPFFKSEKMSKWYKIGVFNHIDIEVETENTVVWYEIKATIKDTIETKMDYIDQLAWHWMLLAEKAESIGKEPVLLLCHYDTSEGAETFDSSKLMLMHIYEEDVKHRIEQIEKGLIVIGQSLDGFEYAENEGIAKLSEYGKSLIPAIECLLAEAKEAQDKADELKDRLKEEMENAGVRSIDNESFKILFIPATTQERFDTKKFQSENPELSAKYTKTTNVKSQIRVTLKK